MIWFPLKTYKHTPIVCMHTTVEAEYVSVKTVFKNIFIIINGTQKTFTTEEQ